MSSLESSLIYLSLMGKYNHWARCAEGMSEGNLVVSHKGCGSSGEGLRMVGWGEKKYIQWGKWSLYRSGGQAQVGNERENEAYVTSKQVWLAAGE